MGWPTACPGESNAPPDRAWPALIGYFPHSELGVFRVRRWKPEGGPYGRNAQRMRSSEDLEENAVRPST